MNSTQKWLLVISALVASGTLAFYFLVYIPRAHQEQIATQQNQIHKQAITQCEKNRDDAAKALLGGEKINEEASEQGKQLFQQMWPEGSIETCSDKLIRDWR